MIPRVNSGGGVVRGGCETAKAETEKAPKRVSVTLDVLATRSGIWAGHAKVPWASFFYFKIKVAPN